MSSASASNAPLAFWARNMIAISDGDMSWPGFSYDEREWTRFRQLAQPISNFAYLKFQLWTATIFIAIAAASISILFVGLSRLYPDPSQTPASVFVAILALVCLATIGFGLPIAMEGASRISSRGVVLTPANRDDDALARKVRRQCWRMTAIMCGVFVPGTLLWIAYDIQAGPIVTALKYGAIGLMAASILAARRA